MENIKEYQKITVGFVVQTYKANDVDNFVCIEQDFIAGDEVSREDEIGNDIDHKIDDTKEVDCPMNMVQPNPEKVKAVLGVLGGVVYAITIPKNVDVKVRDYDIDGTEIPLETDESGDEYHEIIF